MKKLTHGRAPVANFLPPLKEACPPFKGFKSGEKYVQRIFDILVPVIEQQRKKVALRFYPLREVAQFFGVTPGTVQTVYHRLSQEGLLTRIRSSQTMIPARIPRTRFTVRGVVAMPIWLPGFLQFQDWRQWVAIAEEEFSRHRFVAEPIFFQGSETVNPAFADRVLKYNPDYILWFSPARSDTNTMLSFNDAGVPVITLNEQRNHFPARVYPVSYERAYQQGFEEWQQSGEIDRIVIAQSGAGTTRDLEMALPSCALPYQIDTLIFRTEVAEKNLIESYLARLTSQPRTGIIFGDDLFFTLLCNCLPDAMMEIFHRQRVMVQRRVVTPGVPPKNYTADGLFFSWRRLARRIANDLDQAKGSIPTVQPVFQAEWSPRMPLAEIFQSYPRE